MFFSQVVPIQQEWKVNISFNTPMGSDQNLRKYFVLIYWTVLGKITDFVKCLLNLHFRFSTMYPRCFRSQFSPPSPAVSINWFKILISYFFFFYLQRSWFSVSNFVDSLEESSIAPTEHNALVVFKEMFTQVCCWAI